MKGKLAAFAALFALCGTLCGGLCACTQPQTELPGPEPVPDPQYTIDEALIGKDANGAEFDVSAVTMREDSPLKGKRIYWLGSSVTYGSAASGQSMADFLAALTGCISVKETVSGTTIYDDGGNGDSGARSYTRRMVNGENFRTDERVDAFICQISTNDCTNNRLNKRGAMTEGIPESADELDRGTTLGGVEYIIRYVYDTWHCPVYFYSGAYFGDEGVRSNSNPKGSEYGKLVGEVKEIAEKWTKAGYEVGVIDLYNDEAFNAAVTDDYYKWCRSDAIHPKKAGYLTWWTPYIEHFLLEKVAQFIF